MYARSARSFRASSIPYAHPHRWAPPPSNSIPPSSPSSSSLSSQLAIRATCAVPPPAQPQRTHSSNTLKSVSPSASHSAPRPAGSSLALTTIVVLCLISWGSWVWIGRSGSSENADTALAIKILGQIGGDRTKTSADSALSGRPHNTMSAEMLPGRPGTLTPNEEIKLRQFWQATLRVFGVNSQKELDEVNGLKSDVVDERESGSGTSTPNILSVQQKGMDGSSSDKKKKKKRTLFGRKVQEETDPQTPTPASANVASTGSTPLTLPSTADDNDKYGQTKAFKHALANQSPEDLRAAFWSMVKHDHPDGLLLRFLRARKWDVEKALVMLVSTMHWRGQEMHVDDDVMRVGEGGAAEASKSADPAIKKEAEDFLTQLRLGKSYLHGVDKLERPVCIIRVRLHRQGEQSEKSLERYTVYLIETARLFLKPPVDTAVVLFDMTNFSLANMDYAPVKFIIKCFEANYPESLGVVLVHKAPWIFQGIWAIIRGWLDPVVAAKVHFTRSLEDLETFIPRNRIVKELGGDEDWSYSYVEPIPNENHRLSDEAAKHEILSEREGVVKEFEKTTRAWIAESAEGTEKGNMEAKRNDLAERLRKNYWQLDPHVRARTIYDRTGLISEGGKIDFYPNTTSAKGEATDVAIPTQETSPDDVD